MKLVILAVGKGRSAPEAMLAESWISRIHSGGSIIEVESKLPSGPDRQRDESARLLRHVDAGIPLAACDPRGRETSSEALAIAPGRYSYYELGDPCSAGRCRI